MDETNKAEVPPFEDYVATTIGIKTAAGKEALKIALANIALLDRKHQDYGPKNISNHGLHGIIVRMDDKFQRLANLFGQGRRKRALNESVRDTLRDISNYAIIALLFDSGKWPKE